MRKIRILMCCHKQFDITPPLCEPIQGGAAINPNIIGILHDNDGENISDRNCEYCELTAHYYAWKNIDADYYGFCHYRRFFCAEEHKRPYIVKGMLSTKAKEKLLKNAQYWQNLIEQFDIIAPRAEDMGMTVMEHYCSAPFHYAEDLNLFCEILCEKVPELTHISKKYLAQRKQYFCNMFIMDKQHFFQFCEWLFSILSEFDTKKTLHGDFQSDRTDGYLGELFTGMYISYCAENGAIIKELPRLDVNCNLKKRLGCTLFPSESKRRFFLKKLIKKILSKENL